MGSEIVGIGIVGISLAFKWIVKIGGSIAKAITKTALDVIIKIEKIESKIAGFERTGLQHMDKLMVHDTLCRRGGKKMI